MSEAGFEDLYDDEVVCRVCGCSDLEPCPGGCFWVPDPAFLGELCSKCLVRSGGQI